MEAQPSSKAILDAEGRPLEPTALATRTASLDAGVLNLLDPVAIDGNAQSVLEKAGVYRDTLMRIVLRQTSVSQWCVFKGDGENARETLYPMGAAAAAMFAFFGLHWSTPGPTGELYEPELYTDEDGNRWWVVKSKLWRGDQYVCAAEGKRRIGSGYAKNELDARMDAFENLQSRAARSVFGLGAKSREDFKALGLDLSTARIASFQDHKGAGSSDPNEAVIGFGRETKGKRVTELTDEQLADARKFLVKSIADPEKKNWEKKNKLLLQAIDAEIAKRTEKPAMDQATKDELDKTLILIREEVAALGISGDKLKEVESKLPGLNLAQAKKWLAQYRDKRKAQAPKDDEAPATEPESEG